MAWIDPRYEAHQRKRWLRPDAYRFAAPGTPKAKMPGYLHPWAAVARAEEAKAQEAAEWEALQHEFLEIRRDWEALKREIRARQLVRKYEGQPRDEIGRYSFGKKPNLTSQPSAMRRGGPRVVGTPAQQARLAVASARAREAVSRVRQLDPGWAPPRSATSHDNPNDFEVMIRAKEAETQEAEAHFLALSRAGRDAPSRMRDPPTEGEVLMPGGEAVGYHLPGTERSIRTVTPEAFERIRTDLMAGARRIEPTARYDGVWYKRDDGSIFGLRLSRDHGLTLDVIESTSPAIPNGFRIHQR